MCTIEEAASDFVNTTWGERGFSCLQEQGSTSTPSVVEQTARRAVALEPAGGAETARQEAVALEPAGGAENAVVLARSEVVGTTRAKPYKTLSFLAIIGFLSIVVAIMGIVYAAFISAGQHPLT